MEQPRSIGKRLVYLVVILFGVATLAFIPTRTILEGPTVANLNQRVLNNPEIVTIYRVRYGPD